VTFLHRSSEYGSQELPLDSLYGLPSSWRAMTSSLSSLNLVLVGDNFPTASLSARDFTFRNRSFAEKLRVGPLFQASSRNVEIQAFPERFQVTVASPDDLDILCEGIHEVVSTFLEFVGRRTVNAVGHNAQVMVDGRLYEAMVDALVQKDVAAGLLGVDAPLRTNIGFKSKVGDEDQLSVSLVPDATPGADGGVIDFNFNFDIDGSDSLDSAIGHLRESMDRAEQIFGTIRERFSQEAAR